MMKLIIEKMNQAHISRIAELEKECFSSPWSEKGLEIELSNSFARFYVAASDGEIAGYIGSHNVLGEVGITNIAIFPDFRRKGVATALIQHLLEQMKTEGADFVTLEVRESNSSAISLYAKNGFVKVGERKNFYEKPREDAILMTYYFN